MNEFNLKVNKFNEPVCDFFNKDNIKLGTVSSSFEMNDIRIQINKAFKNNTPIKGIYFLFENNKIYINEIGGIINHKHGFYDTFDNQLDELLGL